jgi:ABC-type sugar transport system permease subunit
VKVEGVVALFVGGLAHALAPILVGAATVLVLREVDRGGEAHLRAVLRGLRGELWRLAALAFGALLVFLLLAVTIVGLPYAVKKAVDWSLVQQVAAFEGRRGRDALRGSRNVVRGRWWRVAAITFVFLFILVLAGPFTGILIIFVTDAPLATINFFGTLLFALALPFVAVALTLLYLDLAARRDSEEETPGMLPTP